MIAESLLADGDSVGYFKGDRPIIFKHYLRGMVKKYEHLQN